MEGGIEERRVWRKEQVRIKSKKRTMDWKGGRREWKEEEQQKLQPEGTFSGTDFFGVYVALDCATLKAIIPPAIRTTARTAATTRAEEEKRENIRARGLAKQRGEERTRRTHRDIWQGHHPILKSHDFLVVSFSCGSGFVGCGGGL
jgi:hypothetical protein